MKKNDREKLLELKSFVMRTAIVKTATWMKLAEGVRFYASTGNDFCQFKLDNYPGNVTIQITVHNGGIAIEHEDYSDYGPIKDFHVDIDAFIKEFEKRIDTRKTVIIVNSNEREHPYEVCKVPNEHIEMIDAFTHLTDAIAFGGHNDSGK